MNKNTNFFRKTLCIVLCLIAIAMLFTACKANIVPFGSSSVAKEEGAGNLQSRGFATTSGNIIYYKHPIEYQLYAHNLKTDETTALGENSFCVINANDSTFYLNLFYDSETQNSGFNVYKLTESGEDALIFSDNEITFPQISGEYLYYLKSVPDFNSGYSSYIYRAKLSEGSSPELVCDVLCTSFYVDGDTLYYCDVNNTCLMTVPVEKALNAVKNQPLESGIKRSSESIEATVLLNETIAANLIVKDGNLYFIDYLSQGLFSCYNLEKGEFVAFNNGIYANNYNITDDYIYYHDLSDYCIYRMNLDGSEIQKVSSICDGQIILSNGKLIYMGISTNEATYGDRYISVCDSEGTVIKDITFTEDYDPYRNVEGSEEYYDDYAFEEELTEETPEAAE